MLFVRKPSGELMAVIDLREINKRAVFHGVSLRSIELLVSSIAGHKWMVKMDLKSAYFCIPLSKDCRQYTAFSIP